MDMEEPVEQDEGIPAWVMTFADLMSLLMCFFVLLLAFSEMDAQKFKQLAGSMKSAFGVQADIKADFIPKGTSVVTREFAPGRPEETTLDEVRQFTIDTTKSTLEFSQGVGLEDQFQDIQEALDRLKDELKEEIEEGRLTVRREGSRIVIQIHEQGSFASGFADVKQEFLPTLDKISRLCVDMSGIVQVTGHTDNIPISNSSFRSNWDLSSRRAVTVAHRLLINDELDPRRLVVTGLASTQPRVPNDTPQNRAQNRRVEISILRMDDADEADDADSEPAAPPAEETAVTDDVETDTPT